MTVQTSYVGGRWHQNWAHTSPQHFFMCVHAKWQKSVFFLVKRSVPKNFHVKIFRGQFICKLFLLTLSVWLQLFARFCKLHRQRGGLCRGKLRCTPAFISKTVFRSVCGLLSFWWGGRSFHNVYYIVPFSLVWSSPSWWWRISFFTGLWCELLPWRDHHHCVMKMNVMLLIIPMITYGMAQIKVLFRN